MDKAELHRTLEGAEREAERMQRDVRQAENLVQELRTGTHTPACLGITIVIVLFLFLLRFPLSVSRHGSPLTWVSWAEMFAAQRRAEAAERETQHAQATLALKEKEVQKLPLDVWFKHHTQTYFT